MSDKKEPTTRELLIERVVDNFTYKKPTKEKIKVYNWITEQFLEFTTGVEQLFDFSKIKKRLIDTSDYAYYKSHIGASEKWANGAVANDWKSSINTNDATELEYAEETTTTEKQRLCYEISKRCFEFTVRLSSVLPEGRHLSLFVTEMQLVRGWLLNTINNNL